MRSYQPTPYFFAERGGRIECNGARDQRKPKIGLTVRTRRHWILLNNTRRVNYTANFSKCLRPLSGCGSRGRDLLRQKSKSRGPGCSVAACARRAPPPAPGPAWLGDSTPMAWYRSLYAPRTGGAYDSHHRTAGVAGRARRRGGWVAAGGARAAGRARAVPNPDCTNDNNFRRYRPFFID